ncbi:MAG TPA: hypothetical protein VG320_10400, partial [Paraburkholderia sp.]|uniref:hypothetical protein n=1 Tax=Paraburkholderia sp. TaxID=1926495 RepID=UPI002DF68B7E|nr:hypothetical protein [Paraburkholderia sp.]
LEYFAGAIAAYFKSDCNSFKEMPKAISRPKTPTKLYEQLNQLHASGLESFAFVLSAGNNGRSIRDEIAHYSFVSAGCVNLSARGFVLAGGGEGLEPFSGLSLTEALKSRVDQLSGFLNESLRIFTDTLREHHSGDTMTTDGLAIDDTTKG